MNNDGKSILNITIFTMVSDTAHEDADIAHIIVYYNIYKNGKNK